MNIALWGLQVLLALHTAIGAGWKSFNTPQAVPSLSALPSGVWFSLIPLELLCAAGLVLPAVVPSAGWVVPLAALGIALEMLVFSGVHLRAAPADNGQMIYWLVVAVICAVIAVGRMTLAPL